MNKFVNVHIGESYVAKLRALSVFLDTTKATIVRSFIDDYLDAMPPLTRKAFELQLEQEKAKDD